MKNKTKGFIFRFIITLILLIIVGCVSGGGGSDGGNGIDPSIEVAINQIETECLDPGTEVTAYVTVVNQNGNSITTLIEEDFTIAEDTNIVNLGDFDIEYAEQINIPISVTLVLDYSNSISQSPDVVDAMEDAAIAFIDELADMDGDNMLDKDEVEVIKFALNIENVSQGFISDKVSLTSAIRDFWDGGTQTYLYDALIEAINDTAPAPDRRAVIVLTDGENNSKGNTTVDDVISLAQASSVPIFTIGLGSNIDKNVLMQIADETGGIFYHPANADNLRKVYLQLADALILNQYVITIYESSLAAGTTSDLEIEVEYNDLWDSDWSQLTTCP